MKDFIMIIAYFRINLREYRYFDLQILLIQLILIYCIQSQSIFNEIENRIIKNEFLLLDCKLEEYSDVIYQVLLLVTI